jgi:hypothetical protein
VRNQPIISESDIQECFDFLTENAVAIGKARERQVRAGHMLKHIEALEFKGSAATSDEKRKADARTSPKFLRAIHEDAVSAGEMEKLKSLKEAAQLKIEAWRTLSSNYRSIKL